MNYTEARVYLDEVSKYGSVLGLESMRELLSRLGDPQDSLKFIHISGTNGKGSVLAYLSTILSGAGYRTGRYLSPTLFSYRERIQVDGAYIEKESLARHVTAIAKAADDVIFTWAGTEIAVATTKAFSTQLSVMYLIALYMAQTLGTMAPEALAEPPCCWHRLRRIICRCPCFCWC